MSTPHDELGPTATEVTAAIAQIFDANGWRYLRQPETGEFMISFGRVTIFFRFLEDRHMLLVACRNLEVIPGSGPQALSPERRLQIMELLLHTNYSMILGKCSLDGRDAEILLEMAVPLVGNTINEALITSLLAAAVGTYNDLQPRIAALKYGALEPATSEPLRF